MLLRRFAFIVVFTIFLTGCWVFRAEPVDLSSYIEQPAGKVGVFLDILNRDAEAIQSLHAQGRLKVKRGFGSEMVESVVAFQRPDKLRLDFFDEALHRLMLLVVIKEGRVKAFNSKEKIATVGLANPAAMGQLLSVALYPEEIMLWLCGKLLLPTDRAAANPRLYWNPRDGKYLLRFVSASRKLVSAFLICDTLTSRECHPQIAKILLQDIEENEVLAITKYTYNKHDNPNIPVSLNVELPHEDVVMQLNFNDVQVNSDPGNFSEQLFELKIPKGIEVRTLE